VILVNENLTETSSQSIMEHENKEKLSASLPPEGGKPYLESFQPNLDTTKDTLSPDEVSTLTQKEKIPWQLKELNTAVYSDDGLFIAKEAKVRESETLKMKIKSMSQMNSPKIGLISRRCPYCLQMFLLWPLKQK